MRSPPKAPDETGLIACQKQLDRFFAAYPNPTLNTRTVKALRFLATGEKALMGKPEGWAAGVIYAIANLDRQPCGVPGLLNSEFTEFFGVTMETIRRRAAEVASGITI